MATTLLETAFQRLSRLPQRDQEFYARQLLRELDAEERWDDLFEGTTDAQWRAMVSEAKGDVEENGPLSLDELKASL
jgi:hypothetical protein